MQWVPPPSAPESAEMNRNSPETNRKSWWLKGSPCRIKEELPGSPGAGMVECRKLFGQGGRGQIGTLAMRKILRNQKELKNCQGRGAIQPSERTGRVKTERTRA